MSFFVISAAFSRNLTEAEDTTISNYMAQQAAAGVTDGVVYGHANLSYGPGIGDSRPELMYMTNLTKWTTLDAADAMTALVVGIDPLVICSRVGSTN